VRSKGKIASWNDDKGYGFIAPLEGGDQVFVHISAFSNRNRRRAIHDVVSFGLSTDKQGRPCASNATLAGDKLKEKAPHKSNPVAILFAVLFLCGVGVSFLAGTLPRTIVVAYATLSLITYLAYARGKWAARTGRWRTQEVTLHLLGLAGGWPGALIAQQTLRHKSKKGSFRAALWFTVILNCSALAWLYSESGRAVLKLLAAGTWGVVRRSRRKPSQRLY